MLVACADFWNRPLPMLSPSSFVLGWGSGRLVSPLAFAGPCVWTGYGSAPLGFGLPLLVCSGSGTYTSGLAATLCNVPATMHERDICACGYMRAYVRIDATSAMCMCCVAACPVPTPYSAILPTCSEGPESRQCTAGEMMSDTNSEASGTAVPCVQEVLTVGCCN